MQISVSTLLLKKMADGYFHSGEVLAKDAGISRTGIWKTIKKIEQDYGLIVQSVPGRGYRLQHPIILLQKSVIRQKMSGQSLDVFEDITIFPSVDSTNRYLYNLAVKGIRSPQVVLAEHQSQGQGRRGRCWASPFGKNIYMSVLWQFDFGMSALAGLSLVIAIVIARALNKHTGITPELKWPNDIFYKGKKLGGNLLEVQGESTGPCSVIIGIGLNVNMSDENNVEIDQPWTDLKLIGSTDFDRNFLCAAILDELVPAMQEFASSGLSGFIADWHRWDMIRSKPIKLMFSEHFIEGKACGIDQQGALLMEYNNEVRAFHMGEVSVRVSLMNEQIENGQE